VKGCADAKTADGREVFGCECALEVECGGDRVFGPCERNAKCVAECFEDVAAVRFHCRTPDCVVPLHRRRHRFAMRVPALRAPFNIREEKRDRSRGERRNIERGRTRETACHFRLFGIDYERPRLNL
jgi:hypothetical protein